MATLKDLSEYTGYSIATISRILNSDPSMSASEETRRKVLEAADTLNYAATKSRKGRNLKTILRLGVVLSCPHPRIAESYERVWRSCIGRVCRDMKIEPIEVRFDENGSIVFPPGEIDGIFAIGSYDDAQTQQIVRGSRNVIFIGTSPDERHCDAVVINSRAGIMQAIEFLMEFGHRKIGYVGPCTGQRKKLYTIYEEAMQSVGLGAEIWSLDVEIDAVKTRDALLAYLREGGAPPTALLIATDENALGIMDALGKTGYSVPEDVSVIAFSSTAHASKLRPALTAVRAQTEEMCRAAVRLICERIPGQVSGEARVMPKKVLILPELVKRDSVMPPRDK